MKIFHFILLAAVCMGCRAKPAPDDYGSQEVFKFDAGVDAQEIAEFELGPNPYRVGNERLSVGIFYEGGSSEEYRLNPPERDLQVFILDPNDPKGRSLWTSQVPTTGVKAVRPIGSHLDMTGLAARSSTKMAPKI